MNKRTINYLDILLKKYKELVICKEGIIDAFSILKQCFSNGNKLLIAGNGGSCADAEHIVGELMKNFRINRMCSNDFAKKLNSISKKNGPILASKLQIGFPAIALHSHPGLNTAFLNDVNDGGLFVFAQQTFAYGKKDDVFLGISTSGNALNVLYATIVAKALGMKTICLTGNDGGQISKVADVSIIVPLKETFEIQELHLPIYHCLCLMLEEEFFGIDESNN